MACLHFSRAPLARRKPFAVPQLINIHTHLTSAGILDDLIAPLTAGETLNETQIESAVSALVDDGVSDESRAAFLRALRAKGETPSEIAAFAAAMLDRAVDPGIRAADVPGPLLDVCGTGGDRLHLFNVSTTACFILAAGGAVIVKHGNRAISSRSGGADVLAALGVRLDLPPESLRQCLEAAGMGFLFAPLFHPAFKAVAAVRRQLAAEGTSTVFNLLGPLLNPVRPANQLVGVFSSALTPVFAEVLQQLGRRRVWAVHGEGGMDELSILGATDISRFDLDSLNEDDEGGVIIHEQVFPEDAGLTTLANADALRGGEPDDNARVLTGMLAGEIQDARLDLVLLNAAAGFVAAGLAADLREGAERARETIRSGQALARLRALIQFSEKHPA